MHAVPHKRRNREYSSHDRLNGSKKKSQCRKTKYNPEVYDNILLLRSAAGALTLPDFIISFQSNFECLDGSWCPLSMSVSVAANGVLQFVLLILCISFKSKLVKFIQSPISPTLRFPHNSTSILH